MRIALFLCRCADCCDSVSPLELLGAVRISYSRLSNPDLDLTCNFGSLIDLTGWVMTDDVQDLCFSFQWQFSVHKFVVSGRRVRFACGVQNWPVMMPVLSWITGKPCLAGLNCSEVN